MQYLLLIYSDEANDPTGAAAEGVLAEYGVFTQGIVASVSGVHAGPRPSSRAWMPSAILAVSSRAARSPWPGASMAATA